MIKSSYDIAIVGGGISGLAAAIKAESHGLSAIIIESSDRLGGRIKTDSVNGFLLDHGFQVLLTEYQKAQEILNFDNLGLNNFRPGALITNSKSEFRISDPMRDPSRLFSMAFSPIGSLSDKIKMWKLSNELAKSNNESLFSSNETTLSFLQNYGFSDRIIEQFFKPFFGGIFLERDLKTSSAMFRFVFKCFGKGSAALPSAGMEAIPIQMSERLQTTDILLNTKVESVSVNPSLNLEDGKQVNAAKIILACNPTKLIPQLDRDLEFKSTVTVYFEGGKELKKMDGLIGLDARPESSINNYCRLDEVQPTYAPTDKSLWCLTLRAPYADEATAKKDLAKLIHCEEKELTHLKTYNIPMALPVVEAPLFDMPPEQTQITGHVHLAGDYLLNASIDGALRSGWSAATAAAETIEKIPV